MALTEKQIKKRMDAAWEMHYAKYDMEAEWYGLDDSYIWVCDIPSKHITVKMVLNEKEKQISIYEAPLQKQNRYDYIRETKWQATSNYNW